MNRALIVAAALSMLAAPAMAENKVERCTAMASAARSAMNVRQTGADLPSIVAELSKALDGNDLAAAIGLMNIAYGEPLYSTERAKETAANEFSSMAFVVCMEESA